MGRKTKIDWCDSSWNPVTGCLHGCEYCYARSIANRFKGGDTVDIEDAGPAEQATVYEPIIRTDKKGIQRIAPYPYGFTPTLHRYRLDEPERWKKPRTIFVCSMADLFGEWVPDAWIQMVLEACRAAPQHRYLFLTKNPDRYDMLVDAGILTLKDTNFWLGSTAVDVARGRLYWNGMLNNFISCEPMHAPWPPAGAPNEAFSGVWPEWVIFGAETGNRKGKIVPKRAWIDNAVAMCRSIGAKVFMKESLRDIMGDGFIQEFPWSV